MLIKFYTFNQGHLVSDKEFERLKNGFAKEGMELVRKEDEREPDIILVKGFSHTWEQIPHDKPVVYLSIGTEYKKGIDLKQANEPLRELYDNANFTIHISDYCRDITHKVFGKRDNETIIIPACEPNLPDKYEEFNGKLKLATTCIPRPVKRIDDMERLCKKYDIELIPAYGNVSDFGYYHTCHGYIHLSRKEGMPNTVLEALSYGLPCIVTNYGGAKEAVGEAGIVINNDHQGMWDIDNIEPIDEILFADAIDKFKKQLPELRIKVRERVLTELNDKVMAQQFKQVFNQLI